MVNEFANINVSDTVKITLQNNLSRNSEGKISQILSDSNTDKKLVVLDDGSRGYVVSIINSIDIIKKRIMTETQYTENKESFFGHMMKEKSIPYTIQSFLNSDGGYLYIGVKDTGTLQERLIGIESDLKNVDDENKNLLNDKLCDKLEMAIDHRLDVCLECSIKIAPLLAFNFINIDGVQILEIKITKSSKPVFFKHISNKTKKLKKFQIYRAEEHITDRFLDDFYIRSGNMKKLLSTNQEFYEYASQRFKD